MRTPITNFTVTTLLPITGFKVINHTVGLLDHRNLQKDIVAELHATANHSLLTAAFCNRLLVFNHNYILSFSR